LNGSSSGWEVAEAFRAARPSIAVVYVSGDLVDHDRSVSGSLFFTKPYRPPDIFRACQVLTKA
jgi:hypothetical protein